MENEAAGLLRDARGDERTQIRRARWRDDFPPQDCWPTVDEFALAPRARAVFLARYDAVRRYLEGEPARQIVQATGVARAELYRQLERAMRPHADGRIWGFRALIPRVRVGSTVQGTRYRHGAPCTPAGQPFRCLLARYPSLADLLRDYVLKLRPAGRVQESRIRVCSLHTRFLNECRRLGLQQRHEYPFTTRSLAYPSVARYVKRLLMEPTPRATLIAHGEQGLRKSRVGDGSGRPEFEVYQRVECDAHRIDAVFCLLVPALYGDVIPVVVPRLWVIVLQDVASRAVLGYHLSLNRECTEDDLLKAIQNALSPWKPDEHARSRLPYQPGSGLPPVLGEAFTGVCWNEFSVDGAKINLDQRVQSRLHTIVGATVTRLPRRLPDDRPFIERLFRTLEEQGFHRLPSTTGCHPADIRRANPELKACKYFIQLEDLRLLLDVLIANYNARPHAGLAGRTPLEHLAWGAKDRRELGALRYVRDSELKRLRAVRSCVTVRGGKGRRPFVTFQNAVYSIPTLSPGVGLVGQQLFIECDPDDARMVFAYRENGEEMGPLMAAPPWGHVPHSLFVRKLVAARIRAHRWAATDMEDPVMALLGELEQRVRRKKVASNDYLQLRQYLLERSREFRAAAEDRFPLAVSAHVGAREQGRALQERSADVAYTSEQAPASSISPQSAPLDSRALPRGGLPAPRRARIG